MDLSAPISQAPRVGPVIERRLKKLGLKTLRDLLYHFPQRYEDFSRFWPIGQLPLREDVALRGQILEINSRLAWRKRMTLTQALVGDDSGAIKAVWFAKPYLVDQLRQGDRVIMTGRVSQGKNGLYLNNPSYEKTGEVGPPPFSKVAGLMPVYPETAGLPSRWIRNIIRPLLAAYKQTAKEFLPLEIRQRFHLPELGRALWQIHFPDSLDLAQQAKERFVFEQLFLIELFVLKEKIKILQTKAFPVPLDLKLVKKFVASLPFRLTDAQRKAAWQILRDLEKPHPMNRLLEGEVGSGKTVVATLAALNVSLSGRQVAFLAPTEILAKQHFKEVSRLLFDFKPSIALLTGKDDKITAKKLKGETIEASRQKILQKCLAGEIDLLIGTHALIQKSVRFKNLGLVIVDEQHRFGVEQRARLLGRGTQAEIPHLLSMTATPIPRSLALTLYGDLDLSVIDQLPLGRRKIMTQVVSPSPSAREQVYHFIREQIESGRQAFVICPRIKNPNFKAQSPNKVQSTKSKLRNAAWLEVKTVEEEKNKLTERVFPDLRVEMLHGQMKTREKENIMRDFKRNKIPVLVATSVVEVGIDIPNATVMVIEGADRFGLAQLHQLRGRVGRSVHQSYCFLFTGSAAKKTQARLEALVKSQDGFELSQKDLEIRGPGQFSGQRQWGLGDLAMDSLKDLEKVARSKAAAREILEKDLYLKNYPALEERVREFGETTHLE